MSNNNKNNGKITKKDKMTLPAEIIPANIKLNDLSDSNLEKFFEKINQIDENDQIVEARCKFCKSELREQGEQIYEKTRRWTPVMEFFNNL